MSSIIQTVSYQPENSKPLLEKLAEHLGIHKLQIILTDGERVEGIISEVGEDYINVMEGQSDLLLPLHSIKYFRYIP